MKKIESTIREIYDYLGIDPLTDLKNANVSEDQKIRDVYKMTLTAALTKQQQNEVIEQDFNIEEFVEAQCQALEAGTIGHIPPILFDPATIQKLKSISGNDIKLEVLKIFDKFVTITTQTERERILAIFCELGILAVSVAGMAVSIAALVTGGLAAAGIAGLVVSGISLVTSVASLILTILGCGERLFYGLIINDTPYSITLNGEYVNAEENGGATNGAFFKHGRFSAIFCDKAQKNEPFINGLTEKELSTGCAPVGLFLLDKTSPAFGPMGMFGLSLDKAEHKNLNLMASCPMSDDNRMMISFDYTGDKNWQAYDRMYNAMSNRTTQSESRGGVAVKSTINDSRNSPAFGIVSLVKQ